MARSAIRDVSYIGDREYATSNSTTAELGLRSGSSTARAALLTLGVAGRVTEDQDAATPSTSLAESGGFEPTTDREDIDFAADLGPTGL